MDKPNVLEVYNNIKEALKDIPGIEISICDGEVLIKAGSMSDTYKAAKIVMDMPQTDKKEP